MISEIKCGNIPPPDPPPSLTEGVPQPPALTLTPTKHSDGQHKVNVEALKEKLMEGCSRLGDHAPYGKKGGAGMAREGVKWAVTMI